MVVEKEMQLVDREKELSARISFGSASGAYYQRKVGDSAMEEQVGPEVFNEFHDRLHSDRPGFFLQTDVFWPDARG